MSEALLATFPANGNTLVIPDDNTLAAWNTPSAELIPGQYTEVMPDTVGLQALASYLSGEMPNRHTPDQSRPSKRPNRLVKAAVAAVASSLAFIGTGVAIASPAEAATAVGVADHAIPGSLQEQITRNYAGYEISGHTFKSVKTAFFVPRVTCTSRHAQFAEWSGLSGDDTIEQVTVYAICDPRVTYSAAVEEFPLGPAALPISVAAGDEIKTDVSYTKGSRKFHFSLRDVTRGTAVTESASCPSGEDCARDQALDIGERLRRNGTFSKLPKLGATHFTRMRVVQSNGKHHGAYHYEHDGDDLTRLKMTNRRDKSLLHTTFMLPSGSFYVKERAS